MRELNLERADRVFGQVEKRVVEFVSELLDAVIEREVELHRGDQTQIQRPGPVPVPDQGQNRVRGGLDDMHDDQP